jgi:dienelactone hydrolase
MRAGARGKADTRSALDAFVFRFRVHDDATVRLIWHLDFGCPPREISETAHAREALMTIRRMLPVFLVAAFALATNPAPAEMKSQWVEYTHGDTKLKAYMVYDDRPVGQRPAVLMIHAREGMTPKTLGLAEIWAKLGYVSFAADIFGYGQGVLPKDVAEMQAQTAIYTKDRTLMQARTQAGFDALVKNPMVDASKIALIGYCFGGAVGVEFGATGAPLVANVSIHGSFRDHEAGWAKNARGMYLILHGAEDQSYPLTAVDRVIQELRAWKVPFQLEVYSGTGHGFSTPKNKAEERANAQSIASTARTLKELFGI